jgi:hypothetical protein
VAVSVVRSARHVSFLIDFESVFLLVWKLDCDIAHSPRHRWHTIHLASLRSSMTGLKRENSAKSSPYWQQSPAGKQQQEQPLKQQHQLSHQQSFTPAEADEHLFVTPTDLLCPITLG